MTADQARDEMLAVLKAAWDATAVPSNMSYPDKPFEPPDNEAWGRVTIRHANGQQRTFSAAMRQLRYARTGTLWVQVFAPAGDGNVTAYGLAETVVNAYQGARGTVWYRNVRMREQGADGAFSRVDVLADFTYDNFT